MRFLVRFFLKILFKLKVSGSEYIDTSTPTVYIANHLSLVDGGLLYAYLPKDVHFVVNTERANAFRLLLRGKNIITIDQSNPHSIKKIISVINDGRSIVMFPEGRISTTGNLMKFYKGISLIALKAKAKIQPIVISGLEYSPYLSIKGKFRVLIFPKTFLSIEMPITINEPNEGTSKEKKETVTNKLFEIMQDCIFKNNLKNSEHNNLFDRLLSESKTIGRKRIVANDINGNISYKKTILTSYILGDKINLLTKNEKAVGVFLPNAIGNLVTLFSLFYIGKTPVILNFSSGVSTIIDCIENASLKTVLTSKAFVEAGGFQNHIEKFSQVVNIVYLEDLKSELTIFDKIKGLTKYFTNKRAKKEGENKVILFTSGSENKPKGVVLTHKNIITNIIQCSTAIDLNHKDKLLNPLPMFHSFGLTAGTFLPIFRGVEVFLYPSPLNFKIIPAIAYDFDATVILGTPTFLKNYAINADPYDFYTIRLVISGGEKMKDDVRELWANKFGVRILEGYGATEASPVLSINSPMFNKKGSTGKFVTGVEYKLESVPGIIDGGQLFVRGPNLYEGYLIHNKGFIKSDEWYDTGDVVSIDAQGFVFIKSRIKRFAKVSGEMISLDLVEQLCQEVYTNYKNAVISIQSDKKGERLVLISESKNISKQDLRSHIKEKGYSQLMCPEIYKSVDKVPLLGNGKIDYVTLKKENE